MNTETTTSPELSFLAGGGSLAGIIAGFDWASTPLGPIGSWPISIKTTVGLIVEARARHPRLPVILATGYAELPRGGQPGVHRLSKPFSQAELADALADVAAASLRDAN